MAVASSEFSVVASLEVPLVATPLRTPIDSSSKGPAIVVATDDDEVGGDEPADEVDDPDSDDDSDDFDDVGDDTGFNDDLDDEDDDLDEFDDIDEDDFDDNFDDDFEEEVDDDYEIEIDNDVSAEYGLNDGSTEDFSTKLDDFEDFDSIE